MRLKTDTNPPRIVLNAPVGYRTSTLLMVDTDGSGYFRCMGHFETWDKLDLVLRGQYDLEVGTFKKLLYCWVLCPLGINMTLARGGREVTPSAPWPRK